MTKPPTEAFSAPPLTEAPLADPENPAAHLKLEGLPGKIVWAAAIIFALWQIYTAAFSPVSSIVVRSLHVGGLLFLTFALFRFRPSKTGHAGPPLWDWGLGLLALAIGFYQWVFEGELIQRAGDPNPMDLIVGVLALILLVEGSRRIMGWALPILCVIFIPYAIWGRSLPEPLLHRGFDWVQVIDTLSFGTEGIYGTPTAVSATFIFLFILFGAFLEKAGMIGLFNDVALGTVGHTKGGPAKVAVISSGLMGTINGSGVANVLTTGQFTIPLMIRFGYRPAFAGAVEATASMGGQIMPPVMGAVAFIMAERLELPYSEIALAAIIPALLYYLSAFWMVHLEAGKFGLKGLPADQRPAVFASLKRNWHLILPLAALVYMLFSGFTPLFAGVVGLGLTIVLILGGASFGKIGGLPVRAVAWISLGAALGSLVAFDALSVAATLMLGVAGLVLLCAAMKGWETLRLLLDGLADGAKSALGVGVACALVGILIGIMTLTGLATTVAGMILDLAGDNLAIALLLTMVVCLVLGTGLPTIPNYIITSSIAAPVLEKMGVPPLISHMFCFYFGIMADLTPPVALAALAAQSIAKAGHMEIGWIATRIGAAGYVVPFMAVYAPELMLQGTNVTPLAVGYIVLKAVLAILLWGGAATGWLLGRLGVLERCIATACAILLVAALPITDELGFAGALAFFLWHRWQVKRRPELTRIQTA
ncbi:MAG: TRAP transporter permease [Elstera sp.]